MVAQKGISIRTHEEVLEMKDRLELRVHALVRLLVRIDKKTKPKTMNTKNETVVTAEPGRQEILITRSFDAPRALVFQAFTEPDLVAQWLGPADLTMKVDHMECRTGGSYRYMHIDAQGNEFAFNGVVHEVAAPERIIQTFEFEGLPERGHVSLETISFEELPGDRTKVTMQSVFKSVADRDGLVASGMERGVRDSHRRLEALLAKGL